jgi:hypothetical protein
MSDDAGAREAMGTERHWGSVGIPHWLSRAAMAMRERLLKTTCMEWRREDALTGSSAKPGKRDWDKPGQIPG